MTDEERLAQWRKDARDPDYAITSCGRLDLSTTLPGYIEAGRVYSDRVRYVYFEPHPKSKEEDRECIVVGTLCDHVAFRAADYDAMRERAERAEAHLGHIRASRDAVIPPNPWDWQGVPRIESLLAAIDLTDPPPDRRQEVLEECLRIKKPIPHVDLSDSHAPQIAGFNTAWSDYRAAIRALMEGEE